MQDFTNCPNPRCNSSNTGNWVYECKKCGMKICDACSGVRCPNAGCDNKDGWLTNYANHIGYIK